jgi:GTP-binding protein EngB required for normal cell division
VPTKVDKLNRRDYERRMRELKKSAPHIFPVSSLKKTGIKELQKFLFENWLKAPQNKA